MIILGIDFGTERIGLATGDTASTMVFPLRTIDRRGGSVAEAAATVLEAATAEGAGHLVVGVPVSMGGGREVTKTGAAVFEFIEALKAKTALTVDVEDERLTSKLADQRRLLLGIKRKKFDRDAVAAAEILDSYMQRHFRRDDVAWMAQ